MKVTIITVVHNGREFIADCLESVLGQTYDNIEYIVIDGGSTDGTLEVIDQYRARITRVISEADQGVYDAMNKGIALATGDIVGLLNSDDIYADRDVISRVVAEFIESDVEACYADLVYVDRMNTDRVVRYWRSCDYKEGLFRQGWMPPHPTFFVKRSVYAAYGGFNLALGSSADYELMLRFLHKNRVTSSYIPQILVHMRMGGTSNASLTGRLRAHCMDRKAWRVNDLRPALWTVILKPLRKIPQYFRRPPRSGP
ncbi:MAG: glycosyltransferase [Nitrospirae bacterium]|nr:MAG: glycosyltransferase [Nitrospirota bacterium]